MTIPTDFNISSQIANNYPTFGQLKNKFEIKTMTTKEILSQDVPELSILKVLRTSKVKGMASLFNSKIAQQSDDIEKDKSKSINSTNGNSTEFVVKNKLISQSSDAEEQQPIPSPRTKTKFKAQQNIKTFFVPEDKFAKLTVKDKVSLYNQFVNEMSAKNPKFVKHAELMEASANKVTQKSGVVAEKQASVKHLLAKLEAKCSLPRQTLSPLALQRITAIKNNERKSSVLDKMPIKSKEFEDTGILENNVNHISSLTVQLKPTYRADIKKERRSKSLPRYRTENENALKTKEEIESSNKRNNAQMRYSLPFEAYAPPRKIRRTRAERLTPKIFFQSEQLEILFFTWLNGREQEQKTEKSETAEASNVDQLLEETLNKLEGIGNEPKEESGNRNNEERDSTISPAYPTPNDKANDSLNNISLKSKDFGEYESGLSSLPKITSDESQNKNLEKKNAKELEFSKPIRPQRKKKLRRTLSWKNQPVEETQPISNSNSTDSDNELKIAETKAKNKMLFLQKSPINESDDKDAATQPSSEELNDNLIREVNSPSKIKSVYTLTAFSSSPTPEEEEVKSKNIKQEIAPSWAKSLETSHKASSLDISKLNSSNIFDSFIDQGFETGSNDVDSPARIIKHSTDKRQDVLFFKLSPTTPDDSKKVKNPFDFSTPIKEQQNYQFTNTSTYQQQCSPITKPLKLRRKSIYDNDSRRSSVAMQVIRESQPLEHHEITATASINKTEQNFYANASTREISCSLSGPESEKNSQFWIKCCDFTLCFDILYNEAERLRLLYEIFSQKSSDNQDLHFGIDNFKFSIQHSFDKENISKRLPKSQEHSHYWFSTGDLAIPFVGRRLPAERIQRIFELLKVAVQHTGVLHFGVDAIEFSNMAEFSTQSPKYSMDSNYSMLVGLQSGNSNGLEGRSKYAWPNSKPVRVSDLDQSDYDCEDFVETDSCGLSASSFGSKQFDLPSSSPIEQRASNYSLRNNSESFALGYENETLDNLFEENKKVISLKQKPTAAVPHLNTIKTQQKHFTLMQEKLSAYNNQAKNSSDTLRTLKESPEYLEQLKSNVAEIINKGSNSGFKNCTVKELESYMSLLSLYADICLQNCSGNLNKVLDALLDQRAVLV